MDVVAAAMEFGELKMEHSREETEEKSSTITIAIQPNAATIINAIKTERFPLPYGLCSLPQ